MSDIFDEVVGDVFDQVATPESGSRVMRAGRNLVGGAVRTLGATLEGVALAPTAQEQLRDLGDATLGPILGIPPAPPRAPRSGGKLYQWGNVVRQAGDRLADSAPEGTGRLERFVTDTLPSAAGSMVSTVGSALVLRRAGVNATAAVAATGAAAGAGDGYLDAIQNGADEETAMFSALANAGLGATEAVPIARWLTRVGGTKAFATAIKEGGEEALQEFFQSVGSNVVAEQLYDPSRPWLQGAWEGAAAGATLGTLGSLLASAVGKVRARRGIQSKSQPAEPPPEADLRFESEVEQVMLPSAPEPVEGVSEAVAAANAPSEIDFSPFDTAGGVTGELPPELQGAQREQDSQIQALDESGVVAPTPQPAAADASGGVVPEAPLDFEEASPSAPAPGPDLGAGAAAETPSVQEPINAPAEPTLSYDRFAMLYQQAYRQMQKYSPDEVGSDVYAERMARLADAYPEYLQRLEASLTPPTAAPPSPPQDIFDSLTEPALAPTVPEGGPATITGSNEQRGSEMLAETGSTPVPDQPTTTDANRPDRPGRVRRPRKQPGPPLGSTPPVDVREPAGPGARAGAPEEAGVVPGPEVSGSPGAAGAAGGQRGGQGDSLGDGVRPDPGPSGGAGGEQPGPDAGGGTGTDPGQPVSDPNKLDAVPSATLPAAVAEPAEVPAEDQNHVLPQGEDWIPSGDKAKARANLDAIRLLRRLEAEQRNPSPEEKQVLARYVGWGGLKQVFDAGKAAYRERPPWNEEQRREFANWEKSWGKLYDETKALLTEEEYAAASRSILNAHYTSRQVVSALWDLATHLGFRGGRALETSAGVGNFLGLTPAAVRAQTQWQAVELDSVSGRILAKLYPQARVQQTGFQSARLAPNSVDLVIGNFPFAKEGPIDKRYPRLSLHNYFFARSLDMAKPGGLVVAITSDSTMDSPSSREARAYMAERADLVGAIRLPNTAFKENAGTEVTTDILVLRKRDGTPFAGQPWLETGETQTYDGKPVEINQYFIANPQMMLGRLSLEGTLYGRADQRALLPNPGQDLEGALKEAIVAMPEAVLGAQPLPASEAIDQGPVSGKVGQLVARDGKVSVLTETGTLETPEWKPAQMAQAIDYIGVRSAVQHLIGLQLDPDATDSVIDAARAVLNQRYDTYRKRHGALNARRSAFLEEDVDFPLALALEDDRTSIVETQIKKGKRAGKVIMRRVVEWEKGNIFSQRTIFPRMAPVRVETVADAYQVSMNFRGRPDPQYIAELTGQPMAAVVEELVRERLAFLNPATGLLEPAWVYLSGNVSEKLEAARTAAQEVPEYQANVQALEKVQPAPLRIEQIAVRLGATWVPPQSIARFLREKLKVEAEVYFEPKTGTWGVTVVQGAGEATNVTTYGVHGYSGSKLVELALNLKSPVVTDPEVRISESTGKPYTAQVKNPTKTLEAQDKQNQLKRAFRDWVPSVPEVAVEIEGIYNRVMNGTVAPRYEPPTWVHYPGASNDITLRDHQKRVVTRMLQNSTLLAHAVGTGKTFAMITAAMEMRRLGLAHKPMIVVQPATLEQFARSFKRLYPTARILVPSAKQRERKHRNRTMSRIATGDWDCVIVPQTYVNMLPDDPERMATWIRNEVRELELAKIQSQHAEGKKSPRAKDLENAKQRLEEKLKELVNRRMDNVVTFEQLGVDGLFVDEAHAYKKLQFTTQMDAIKGLDTGVSDRGLAMFMKVRWVQEKNQGRNVIFATGTPVSNTIAEAWTMMRYLRPDVLKTYGMENFDAFAGSFGDTITQPEMSAGGTWKQVTRFARYVNGPELLAAWRTVADVVTSEEINLPGLPALKNGRNTAVVVKQTPEVRAYVGRLRARLEEFERMTGRQKRENSHIPMVVFGLAKKAGLDMRMVDPQAEDHPESKINRAVQKILETYHDSTPVLGAQMVFADLYQDDPDAPTFNLYQELKRKLVEAGIPEKEVVILTADIKDAKREALFAQFNEGQVRVAIGSTERMGVGVNAQRKLIALHHLDAPARPMDVEQRNGRIIRQGNENPVVEVFSYGVENTLDAAMFQKLATKQRFINQILRGEIEGRDFEDATNELSLSFEEQMAAFSGDPLAVEKVGVDNLVRELEALRAGHATQLGRARDELVHLRQRAIPATERAIGESQRLAARFTTAFPGDAFRLELDGKTYTDRKSVTEALDLWVAKFTGDFSDALLASDRVGWSQSGKRAFRLNGFEAIADVTAMKHAGKDGAPPTLSGVQVNWQFSEVGRSHAATTGGGILQGIPSDLRAVSERPAELQGNLARMRRNETELAGFILQPFEREAELEAALKRQGEILQEIENRTKANKFSYAEWLLDVPRDANKPLEAKRLQAQRILREMETNYAAAVETFNWAARNKKALADMGITPPSMPAWYQSRYDMVRKSLSAIEAQLLQEAQGKTRVYHMMIFPPLPPDPDKQEVRQFMHQVADEPLVSDLAKGQIGNALYSRRGNRDDAAMGVGLITAAGGPEQAIVTWRDPANGVPQMVRAHLGMAIIKQLGVLQARAHAGGQPEEATRLAEVQASFVDEFSERSTDVAQYLQALRMFSSMTPEGFVRTYKRSVDKATREVRDELEPAIQAATQELNAAAQGALPELAGDAEIQAATTKAINESLAQDPVIQNAIRVVVSRSFGSSAVVMAQVKATIQRAFQQIERGRASMPLWEQYRRAAAAQLARLPRPAREKASLDAFTRRVMQALRGQIDAQFPPQAPDQAPRLAPVQQILEAFANPEKYADVWATTLRELRARYPDDPRVDHLATLPAALVSPQTMRSLLEEELTRADIGLGELIARGYVVKDGRILKDRIRDALAQAGVHVADQDVSGLAGVADQEWRKMVEKEEGRTAARLQEARVRESRALRAARSGLVEVENIPESEIDAAIRTRLRETRSQLSSTIRGHWRDQVKEGQDLARAMTLNVGLDPVVAQQLAHRIEERFAKLLAERKAKAIQRAIDMAPRAHRRREVWERLVEASNMGLLSDEDAWRAVAAGLKLPTYSREAASRVMTAANRIQRAPEGFQRDRAVVDLLDTIKKEVGVPVGSLLLSLWYARLLSGPTTHVLNILSNLQQGAMAVTALAARRPGDVPALAGALWDGMVKALPEMAEVLSTGRVTGVRMLKAEPAGSLELAPDKGLWRILKHWRMVARIMAAEDLAVFMPLREARQMALAREMARTAGLKGAAFEAEVERIMGASREALNQADAQAQAEGLTGLDRRRRVNELVESSRPEALREDALDFALRQTFNGKPYGFLGVVSDHLRPVLAKYPAGRFIVPFVNVVANVTNEAINYAPGANAIRLLEAYRKGAVYGRTAAYNDVFELYAKAGTGLVLTAILASLVAAGWDSDEPERQFDISGPGPGGTATQQLLATGWKPWSVKVGSRWVPYTETPLAIAFGSLGTYLDALRYGKLKDRGTLAHVAFAARGMAAVALNRSMLQGLADVITSLRKQGAERDDALMRTLARPVGTVVSSRLVAQIDRMLDPTVRDASTPAAAILSQLPAARRWGKPALNVWGEPIESGPWERFVSPMKDDRLARVLAEKAAWIPMQTAAELGGKRGGFTADERYEFIQERGPALRAHLERLLPRLETLPPEQAREMVSRVAEIHTARAKAKFVGSRNNR